MPGRDLYRFQPNVCPNQDNAMAEDHPTTDSSTMPKLPSQDYPVSSETIEYLPKPDINNVVSPDSQPKSQSTSEAVQFTTAPQRQRRIPPAQGEAANYNVPMPKTQIFIPFLFHCEEDQDIRDQETVSLCQDQQEIPESPNSSFKTPQQSPGSSQPESNRNEASQESPAQAPVQRDIPSRRPLKRQRSGSYPPPAKRPGNTNDWSRRDHSKLKDLGASRPKRTIKPPVQISYDKNFKQTMTRKVHDQSDSSD